MRSEKAIIRQYCNQQLQAFSATERVAASAVIGKRLLTSPRICGADAIAAYAAMDLEVDIVTVAHHVLDRGGTVFYPRYCRDTDRYGLVAVPDLTDALVPGHYGILEPRPDLPERTDMTAFSQFVWLVPGVAFGVDGARLGHGRGYYDRMLSGSVGFRIGVAFDFQLLETVPMEHKDIPMDAVVTERRQIELAARVNAPLSTVVMECRQGTK